MRGKLSCVLSQLSLSRLRVAAQAARCSPPRPVVRPIEPTRNGISARTAAAPAISRDRRVAHCSSLLDMRIALSYHALLVLLVLVFQLVKHGFARLEHAQASAAGKARPACSGSARRPADARAETRPSRAWLSGSG